MWKQWPVQAERNGKALIRINGVRYERQLTRIKSGEELIGIAGAITMYDRVISLGNHPRRPVTPGGPVEELPEHVFGSPNLRQKMQAFRAETPAAEVEEFLETVDD